MKNIQMKKKLKTERGEGIHMLKMKSDILILADVLEKFEKS